VDSQKVRVGQHVWVATTSVPGGRCFGRIASIARGLTGAAVEFVVALDVTPPTVVTCSENRRGEEWDYAAEDPS
jgi:hypothetical protein